MNKVVLACAVTGVVTSALGAAAGYILAKEKLEAEYNLRFEEEMAKELENYDRRNKTGRYEDLEALAKERLPQREPKVPEDAAMMDSRPLEPPLNEKQLLQTAEFLKKYNPPTHMPEGWEESVVKTHDEIDESDTMTDRPEPYIIPVEVWKKNQKGYETPQLFFYSGDKTLLNANGDVVDVEDYVGGLDILSKFGQGSNRINFLYVRNDRLSSDFEIEHLDGSYES